MYHAELWQFNPEKWAVIGPSGTPVEYGPQVYCERRAQERNEEE